MEHLEQSWSLHYFAPEDGTVCRRLHAFKRSREFRVFLQACHDWVDEHNLHPPLAFTWELDEQECDVLALEWNVLSGIDARLPGNVLPNTALLALSAFCCVRLHAAGVAMTVDVKRIYDANDPAEPEYIVHVFTIERRRREAA